MAETQQKTPNLDYSRYSEDQELKDQIDQALNEAYITYGEIKDGPENKNPQAALASADQGLVGCWNGFFSDFWYNPKTKKIEHKVLTPEGDRAIMSMIYVKGAKQYAFFDLVSPEPLRISTITRRVGSKTKLRKVSVHTEEQVRIRQSLCLKYSGVKDLVYLTSASTELTIFSTKNKKKLKEVRLPELRNQKKAEFESHLTGFAMLPSRGLVLLLHEFGALKLVDTGLNVIQEFESLTGTTKGGCYHLNVWEKVPGDKNSPLMIFFLKNGPGGGKLGYLARIDVDPAKQSEYAQPVVLDAQEYKKRHYISNEHPVLVRHLKKAKDAMAERRSLKRQIQELIDAGEDPLSEPIKNLEANVVGALGRVLRGCKDKIIFEGILASEVFHQGPFKLTQLDTIFGRNSPDHYPRGDLISFKFSGFLDRENNRYPLFVSMFRKTGEIQLFVVNEEDRFVCLHPSVKCLLDLGRITSELLGGYSDAGNVVYLF